jgi:hypothetical protein
MEISKEIFPIVYQHQTLVQVFPPIEFDEHDEQYKKDADGKYIHEGITCSITFFLSNSFASLSHAYFFVIYLFIFHMMD